MVDNGRTLKETMSDFDEWMVKEECLSQPSLFVTCGDWDLKQMLPSQLAHLQEPLPPYMQQWMNIKKVRPHTC